MAQKAKLKISARLLRKKLKKRSFQVKKQCRFEADAALALTIDYKNTDLLKHFLTQRGKILPSRVSGNSNFYQRRIAQQIKLARSMALLPYCSLQGH
jgi:small subunit ribosomal protein S18